MNNIPSTLQYLKFAGLVVCGATSLSAQVSYVSGTYTQNFDTLANTGTANAFIDNTTLVGWYAQALEMGYSGTGALTLNMAGATRTNADDYTTTITGEFPSGDLFSYGAVDTTERALGSLGSGTPDETVYSLRVQNDTGLPISRFLLTYDGEQWRRGANTTQRPESLLVYYRIGGNDFLNNTGWTEVPELTFTSPNSTDPLAANLDGNLAENRTPNISKEVFLTTPLPVGESLWIMWVDPDNTGTDHGLGIDNVQFSATVSTGGNVSIGGTTNFTPTSFGGNPFTADDTAVFNGTATTVNLIGNVVAAGLSFTSNNYVLSGTIADSISVIGAISVDTDVTSTISGILSGNTGIVKSGNGTLKLTGANTFTGNISILSGTLNISSDSNLGDAVNDLSLSGALVVDSTSLSLGSGRTLSGNTIFKLQSGGSLNLAGPTALNSVTLDGVSNLTLGGTTNTVSNLSTQEPLTLNITGGALAIGSSLTLNQTSGTTTIDGPVTTGGDRGVFVNGGVLRPTGNVTLGGRIIKTGAGTLDLTLANVSGSGPTTGGYRFGVQGTTPVEGGVLKVDTAAALGNAQLQFNSGTLELMDDLVSSIGISVGGRNGGTISEPTIIGGNLTLSGTNSFFNAGGSDNDILFNVTNTTTLSGAYAPTSTTAITPVWVGVGGTGTLILSGDATRIIDYYIATDTVTLVINGSLGGEVLRIEPGATLSGNGTFTGSSPWEDTNPTSSTNQLTQPANPIYVASTSNIFGTLAPSGVITLRASTTLESGSKTILQINGVARGTEYDAVTVETPAGTAFSYNLNYGGELILDFGSPAKNGTYALFTAGNGTTFGGGFPVDIPVKLTGSHTGSLTKTGSIWSGTSGATFSFDESTGVLTVTGGAAATTALEDWRQTNFGSTANTGSFADSADFDNDGISNLVEYAAGTNPTTANANPITVATKNNAGEFLTLSFNRINDPALTYTILASNDLTGGFSSTGTTYTGSAAGTVVYEDTVSLATPGVRRFLSLQVSYGTP